MRSEHSALNTLLQSAGAVVMNAATINTYNNLIAEGLDPANDFAFVAHVHDEFQIETWPELSDLVSKISVSSIVESGEQFNFRCRLDGDSKVGINWSETH